MEKLIKKGENVPEEFITFFIDGEPINKYVTAGSDFRIKRDEEKVYLSTEENTEYYTYIGSNDSAGKYFILIDTTAMRNAGKNINGPLTQIPSCIHFVNSEKENTGVWEIK